MEIKSKAHRRVCFLQLKCDSLYLIAETIREISQKYRVVLRSFTSVIKCLQILSVIMTQHLDHAPVCEIGCCCQEEF